MEQKIKVIGEIIKRREMPYWALAPAVVAGYALAKAVVDYREWRSLGEGGLPHNVLGWIVAGMCKFSRLHDTRSTSHFKNDEISTGGYLGNILAREGCRPTMAKFVVPLRATDQDPYPDMAIKIEDLYTSLAAKFSSLILMKTSKLEKNCTALFLSNPTVASPSKEINYEMAHYHPYDHSSIVVMHPADAKKVIDAGWGEFHPLAGKANFYAKLPKTYVLIYAPRNDKELEIVQTILEACIRYHIK